MLLLVTAVELVWAVTTFLSLVSETENSRKKEQRPSRFFEKTKRVDQELKEH